MAPIYGERGMTMWTLIASYLSRPRIANMLVAYASRTPYDHIFDRDGSLYMGRYWVLRERRWFPWAARVHFIAREDLDRDKHDHPCDYRTIPLVGGYWWENLFGGRFWLGVGQTNAHPAEHFHKIVEVSEGGVWTLFIYRNRKHRNLWGFLVADGDRVVKVPWREYLGEE